MIRKTNHLFLPRCVGVFPAVLDGNVYSAWCASHMAAVVLCSWDTSRPTFWLNISSWQTLLPTQRLMNSAALTWVMNSCTWRALVTAAHTFNVINASFQWQRLGITRNRSLGVMWGHHLVCTNRTNWTEGIKRRLAPHAVPKIRFKERWQAVLHTAVCSEYRQLGLTYKCVLFSSGLVYFLGKQHLFKLNWTNS